ncbi:MAG: (Fe-S)-binding protein [Thermodesulfobacteriota bacterium]|nr:(Fe-S)-binding protein [Thermodesulfobacteriota bacterium]
MEKTKVLENIRASGVYRNTPELRMNVLSENKVRLDEKAEYVVVGGCQIPEDMPQGFGSFIKMLDRLAIDYTMLSKEYCCGWAPLVQPAVMAKDEENISASRELAREFIQGNFHQAEKLNAKSIALFCAACEPSYTNYRDLTTLEVITYPELIDRFFKGGKLDKSIDYYPGCFRFRKRISAEPLDMNPALRLLQKINGLNVNHIDTNQCCFIPPHMEKIKESLKTKEIVTICTGCYGTLTKVLHDGYKVKMMPELVLESMH